MNIKIRLFAVILSMTSVFALSFTSCKKTEPELNVNLTGNLIGLITDNETSKIIEGVDISLTPTGKNMQTDRDGKFVFNELEAQDYTIQASKTGYTTKSKTITVSSNKDTEVNISLTIEDDSKAIVTTSVPVVNSTSKATVEAEITNIGIGSITAHGHVWDTKPAPTISLTTKIDYGAKSNTGTYSSTLTELNSETEYFVRAFVTNSAGTAYSSEVSFTTNTDVSKPTVTTQAASSIEQTVATLNAQINANGGNTTVSFEYGISTDYGNTINVTTNPISGNSNTNTSANITNLSENTTYNYRVVAINESGTSYGDNMSFTTKKTEVKCQDYEGNNYQFVTIGNQTWMAENLKSTKYADGTSIPLVTENQEWSNLTSNNNKAYCFYNNNANYEGTTYGVLYTWTTAMNGEGETSANPSKVQGICPSGWHLPSEAEWSELNIFIENDGHYGTEGTALKAPSFWNNGGSGTDNYKFSALPGGYRVAGSGSFEGLGNLGYWWTTTHDPDSGSIWSYSLFHDKVLQFHGGADKTYGLSVRCVKD